jgi:hypothetical protein
MRNALLGLMVVPTGTSPPALQFPGDAQESSHGPVRNNQDFYPERTGAPVNGTATDQVDGGSVRLHGSSAFWAVERAALGDGPPDGVEGVGESRFRNFTRCLDRSVRGALSGLGLDFPLAMAFFL